MTDLTTQFRNLLHDDRAAEGETLLATELREHPENEEAATLYAAHLSNLDRWSDAEAMLEDCIERVSEPNAHLHITLGRMHHNRGQMEEAYAAYSAAFAINPDSADALSSLAQTAPKDERGKLLTLAEAAIERCASDTSRCSSMHFAAGRICDAMARYDQAWQHFVSANELAGVNRTSTFSDRFVEDSREVFTRKYFKQMQGSGAKGASPVFVVGMPRSGTTLVEQRLGRHPQVAGLGELDDMSVMAHNLGRSLRTREHYPRAAGLLQAAQAQALGERYITRTREMAGSSAIKRTIDKSPLNFRLLGLIAITLPGAKIIHARRHPLDTCLSNYFQEFFSPELSYSYDLKACGDYYVRYRKIMQWWERVLPLKIHHSDYEKLVADPEQGFTRLLTLCGLKWDPAVLSNTAAKSVIRTASITQARQPIYRESSERWRNYEPWLGPLQDQLKNYL